MKEEDEEEEVEVDGERKKPHDKGDKLWIISGTVDLKKDTRALTISSHP